MIAGDFLMRQSFYPHLIWFNSGTIGSRLVNALLAGSGSEVRDKVLCVVEVVGLGCETHVKTLTLLSRYRSKIVAE